MSNVAIRALLCAVVLLLLAGCKHLSVNNPYKLPVGKETVSVVDCDFGYELGVRNEQECATLAAYSVCSGGYSFGPSDDNDPNHKDCSGIACYPRDSGLEPGTQRWCTNRSILDGGSVESVAASQMSEIPSGVDGANRLYRPLTQSEPAPGTKLTKAASAVTITEYALPTSGMEPGPIIVAGQRVLFGATATCRAPCDNSGVFSVSAAGNVARVEEYCSKGGPDCRISGLTPLPDGGFCYNAAHIVIGSKSRPDLITCVGASSRTARSVNAKGGFLAGLAVGYDGNLWYADGGLSGIGRIAMNGSNDVSATFFKYPSNLGLVGITRGPDSAMWFTAGLGNKIGRINSAGYRLTDIPTPDSQPVDIVVGPDGNLWFTESVGNKIGRITPAGVLTEFPLPSAAAGPVGIAVGPDRALWFTEAAGNKIGRITVLGEITEYPIPTADAQPAGIVAGPDGNMWFTQYKGNKIGKVTVPALPQVIEFYNTNLDNYFVTANAAEQTAIDNGSAGPGWSRTGATFASGGPVAVCRFYGSISPGPNSHFYTADANECAALKQQEKTTPPTQKRWNFESNDFLTSPASNGKCPSGLVPIYRAYNNGFSRGIDSNHRITPSATAIAAVVSRGWSNEGAVMCALQ